MKQWLEVRVKATDHTGFLADDVFYFGNAVGESVTLSGNGIVNATDEIVALNFPHSVQNPTTNVDPYDYDRDTLVDGVDQLVARNNQTNPLTMLRLIAVPELSRPRTRPISDWQTTATN